MGQAGFFRRLCLVLAKMVNYQVIPILATFMLLSGFLAIATRRYAGIRRLFSGSTAQGVLQNTDKPVLLVRVPG
jgi:hypothetical protein